MLWGGKGCVCGAGGRKGGSKAVAPKPVQIEEEHVSKYCQVTIIILKSTSILRFMFLFLFLSKA